MSEALPLPLPNDPGVVIRAALPSDLNFIRRTWLSGLRELPNGLPDEFWWPAHRGYVERQLFSDNNRILILGASDDPHEILGYAVASKEVLEWVHVRKGLRGNGLAGALLRELGFSLQQLPLTRWRTLSSSTLRISYRPVELRK
jgi:ribosomal protein S18 acetylase RimI-like enzyme